MLKPRSACWSDSVSVSASAETVRRDSAKHSVSAETVYTVSVPVSFSAETEKVSFGRPLLQIVKTVASNVITYWPTESGCGIVSHSRVASGMSNTI
jgi:hypothetical protein